MNPEVPPHGPRISGVTILLGVLLTWWVPGLGHYLLGRRAKGLLYFLLLTFTYLFGMWLADFRNVSVENFELYLYGEGLYAGLTLPALWFTRHLELVQEQPWLDAGVLFSTVAGILNVCVMVDVYETARPRPELCA